MSFLLIDLKMRRYFNWRAGIAVLCNVIYLQISRVLPSKSCPLSRNFRQCPIWGTTLQITPQHRSW